MHNKQKRTIDWKFFLGDGVQHDDLEFLPDPPPWRFSRQAPKLARPETLDITVNEQRSLPFKPSPQMVRAVNTALYLRRPLLITGKPGTGKSTLIYKVAHELKLGPVLVWPITSRSTVRGGLYEYDAVARLQSDQKLAVEKYLTLGPLGTAMRSQTWPRPLLIDEIDKSDLDFASDLLNVIEQGEFEIPELWRLGSGTREVRDFLRESSPIVDGKVQSGQFPFVVMTSNAEREFPPPFLRRCIRLKIEPPNASQLIEIVKSQLKNYAANLDMAKISALVNDFDSRQDLKQDVAIDQLLNAVFLTVAMISDRRTFGEEDLKALRETLLRQLSGPEA